MCKVSKSNLHANNKSSVNVATAYTFRLFLHRLKKKCIHLNVQDCPSSDSSRSFLILLEKEQAKI